MNSFRVDYASTSPRADCSVCNTVIRSGEIRVMFYSVYRHIKCVTAIDVLRMWQQCKSFNNVPGFTSLEYADRVQLEELFRTLLVSTPAHSRSALPPIQFLIRHCG